MKIEFFVLQFFLISALVLAVVSDANAFCAINFVFIATVVFSRIVRIKPVRGSSFGWALFPDNPHCALEKFLTVVVSIGALPTLFMGVFVPKFIHIPVCEGGIPLSVAWLAGLSHCMWLVWALAGALIELAGGFVDVRTQIARCRAGLLVAYIVASAGLTFVLIHNASWLHTHLDLCYSLCMGMFRRLSAWASEL